MHIANQVLGLELSKKLKELGFNEDSYFVWMRYNGGGYDISEKWNEPEYNPACDYHAYSTGELLDFLPRIVDTKKDEPFNNFRLKLQKFLRINEENKEEINYIINYECDTSECGTDDAWRFRPLMKKNIHDKNLANAAGTMLIYLIEHKLMDIKNEE
jgi:hypothetical protein